MCFMHFGGLREKKSSPGVGPTCEALSQDALYLSLVPSDACSGSTVPNTLMLYLTVVAVAVACRTHTFHLSQSARSTKIRRCLYPRVIFWAFQSRWMLGHARSVGYVEDLPAKGPLKPHQFPRSSSRLNCPVRKFIASIYTPNHATCRSPPRTLCHLVHALDRAPAAPETGRSKKSPQDPQVLKSGKGCLQVARIPRIVPPGESVLGDEPTGRTRYDATMRVPTRRRGVGGTDERRLVVPSMSSIRKQLYKVCPIYKAFTNHHHPVLLLQ